MTQSGTLRGPQVSTAGENEPSAPLAYLYGLRLVFGGHLGGHRPIALAPLDDSSNFASIAFNPEMTGWLTVTM